MTLFAQLEKSNGRSAPLTGPHPALKLHLCCVGDLLAALIPVVVCSVIVKGKLKDGALWQTGFAIKTSYGP